MKLRRLVFEPTIGLLRFFMCLSALTAFFLTLYVCTNIKPYTEFGDFQKFGLLEFEKGLPIQVSGKYDIPDSTDKIYPERRAFERPDSVSRYPPPKELHARFHIKQSIELQVPESRIGMVHDIELTNGKLYIEPANFWVRLLLCFPRILNFTVTAICLWQISKLLTNVLEDRSFSLSNYRRLRNVGVLIIFFQLVLLAYYFLSNSWFAWASYGPALDNPFPQVFEVKPDFDFSVTWLMVGIMLLIISLAFKTGDALQQEQELTV